MNEKLTRVMAAVLMFVYGMSIVPAQEIASGLAAGKVRIDYYLNRAEKARDENEWKRIADEGMLTALSAWEHAMTALKEQDADAWNASRADAKAYYENTIAKKYADWICTRYTRANENEASSELALRLKEKINAFDTSQYTLTQTKELYDAWLTESRKIVDEYLGAYDTGASREAMRREAEMLSQIEGKRFVARFIKDKYSLKAEKAKEAASAVADDLTKKTYAETERDMNDLFASLEKTIASPVDNEINKDAFLSRFKEVFNKGLAKWEDAEREFLRDRLAWENEAQRTYEESERIWEAAKKTLSDKRVEWEKSIDARIKKLEQEIAEKNKEYEGEINGLLENYKAVLDENASYRYEAAQMQEAVYNNIRDMFVSSREGIENWIALWASKYNGVYSYWKTEDPNDIFYNAINGKADIKIDAETLKIIRANIYDWQDKYIRQVVREYNAVLQQYVSEIQRVQNDFNNVINSSDFITFSDRPDYTKSKAYNEKIFSHALDAMDLDSGKIKNYRSDFFSRYDKIAALKKYEDPEKTLTALVAAENVKNLESELQSCADADEFSSDKAIKAYIADLKKQLAAQKKKTAGGDFTGNDYTGQLKTYLTAVKKCDDKLLQNDNFVVLADALSAGETVLAWYRIALYDKVRLDESIKNLFQLAKAEEYGYGEAELELFRAKTFAASADENYEIAKAVDEYASITDASREAKAETEKRLHDAERAYESAYDVYRALCGKLTDADITRAKEKLHAAYENLQRAKEAFAAAEKENATLIALQPTIQRDTIDRTILSYAGKHFEKNDAVFRAAYDYYIAKFSELEKRDFENISSEDTILRQYADAKAALAKAIRENDISPARAGENSYDAVIDYIKNFTAFPAEGFEGVREALAAYIRMYSDMEAYRYAMLSDTDGKAEAEKLALCREKLTAYQNDDELETLTEEQKAELNTLVLECEFLQNVILYAKKTGCAWSKKLLKNGYLNSSIFASAEEKEKIRIIFAGADAAELRTREGTVTAAARFFLQEDYAAGEKTSGELYDVLTQALENKDDSTKKLELYAELFLLSDDNGISMRIAENNKKAEALQRDIETASVAYTQSIHKLKTAENAYMRKVDTCNAAYTELERLRVAKRCAQAVFDWASSVYLENIGINANERYVTPKEKLSEAAYTRERALLSVQVLENLIAGKQHANVVPAENNELEAYKKSDRAYYETLIIRHEISLIYREKEKILAAAESAERAARTTLTIPFEYAATEQLVHIEKNDDGTWKYALTQKVVADHKSETYYETDEEDNTVAKIRRWTEYNVYPAEYAGTDNTAEQKNYFTDDSAAILRTITQGTIKQTAAEKEAEAWLDSLWKRKKSYRENVILAAMYLQYRCSGDKIKNLQSDAEDIFRMPNVNNAHGIDVYEKYKHHRENVLWDAYDAVIKDGGEDDIAKCIIFRNGGNVLGAELEEFEVDILKSRALKRLADEMDEIESDHTRFKRIFWGRFKRTDAKGKYAGAICNKCHAYRKNATDAALGKDEKIRVMLDTLSEAKATRENAARDYTTLFGNTERSGTEIAAEVRVALIGNSLISKSVLEEIIAAADGGKMYLNTRIFIDETADAYKAKRDTTAAALDTKRKALFAAQRNAADTYYAYVEKSKTLDENARAELRKLALESSDVTASTEARKKSAEKYDTLYSKTFNISVAEKRLFAEYAENAWGNGTYDTVQFIKNMASYYGDYYNGNGRSDFTRSTETYDTYIQEQLLNFVGSKIKAKNASLYDAYKIELMKNMNAAQTEYKNALQQLNDIALLSAEEWTKAQEKMNVRHNTWQREFVEKYALHQREWESNYGVFLTQKQEWINGMYLDAAAETELRQDMGEREAVEKLMEARSVARKALPKPALNFEQYTETLLGETLLGKLERQSAVLQNRISSVAFAAIRHDSVRSDIEMTHRAAEVLAATNKDLQERAVRIAAQQAEQNLIKTRDRYYSLVGEQNQSIEDYVKETVLNSGYTWSKKIIKRRVVVDSNFWTATRKTQTVHPYEWYATAAPDIGIDVKALAVANHDAVDCLMATAQKNLSAWYERVFGDGGEFEKHRGEAPKLKSGGDINIKRGRQGNIEKQGSGEIGLVMLDVLWNDVEESYGWAELSKPDWDQKLWSGSSFFGMDPPSIRTVTTVAATVVATVVSAVCTWGSAAPVVAALCSAAVVSTITMSNELLFAALDLSGGYKTAEEIGKSLAMSAVTSTLSMAGGAAGAGAGLLGGFAGAALKTGISVSSGLTGKFITGGIASGWNWSEMGKQWDDWGDWKGTVIDTAGSAVTNSMEAAMLGNTITKNGQISGYTKVVGFNSGQIGQIKTLAGTAGNLTASAMELGINGETTINVLNTSDLLKNTKLAGASNGLLALTFGKNGAHAEISTAGRNYNIAEITNTIGGMKTAGIALRTNAYERKNGAGTGTALRTQYGFGDKTARQQADDILHGRAELIKDEGTVTAGGRAKTELDGKRKIYVNGNTFDGTVESALAMGIALQHEAYRDGITESSAAQQAETMQSVYKHTEMALRMASDGMVDKMMDGVLSRMPELKSDIRNYNRYMFAMAQAGEDEAKQREAYAQYAAYIDAAYDSSGDYWKLTHGGQLVNDRQGWLKDENGKYIGIDGKPMDEPIEGKTLGARGIETGLLNLLAGTSGRNYDSFTDAQVAIAQQLMKDAGMKAVNGATETDARKLKWSTAKGGQTLNMYEFMNAAGCKVPDTIFAAYYNTTVDSELAKVWNVDLGFEKKRAVPESLAEKYSALRLAHIQGVKHPTGLKNKYKFTVYGSDDIGTEFFKLNENNPFLDDILKQTDSSFNDLQYMQPSGCNFMASMAYPQLLTGKIFSANQIKSLWKEAGKDSLILNITNDINLGQGNVRDPDKLTDFAWKELGKTNSRYNNFALSFGDYTRYNVATYSLPDKLKLKYSYTGHFVLGEILYNSGTTTDFILRRDLVKLYAR
ncbi:S-layer family protein [Treponema sp. Marseille-Q4130]|uniref:S-layer family protein n=1 Tax=Treponema sp. Marseille-Q4130 TaxID=2766702 RepID=UPI001651DAFE|nr:S-layer family protein [Treponema sp. Marseille-Q4130]MBC6719662.1 S-layer family protein [Treponema sp. Marseille-Q4130]